MIGSLDIKTSGPAQPVADLSGGNQQKVVIARALAREPRVLVAIRPTAGVDVKSKDALLGVVRGVADRGRRGASSSPTNWTTCGSATG